MPHLVILYTANLDRDTDMSVLCRTLAATMLAQRDEVGKPVFPIGGTRVLAYPAAHSAVADGKGDYGFVYLNLRMTAGRSGAVRQQMGDALTAATGAHFADLLARGPLGITLQIDEGAEVYNGKHSSLHPLFNKAL
jgi:5-carboxymethyl-2-hydroxymuconate isomerase